MQEMQVWSLGQEDALEKEMATHSSIAIKGYKQQTKSMQYVLICIKSSNGKFYGIKVNNGRQEKKKSNIWTKTWKRW